MTSITWASLRYVQEAATILGSQNRTQGSCDMFIGPALKDEVLKIMPVQKQTRAGQRTRFKAFVGKFYAYFV